MNTCVVALGKIGLPLAVQIASRGNHVVGVDVNAEVVAAVSQGRPHFPGEPGLPERLHDVLDRGLLHATVDTQAAVRRSEVVVVVVPLVVDAEGRPDFSSIDGATESIAGALTPGTLVVYETTVPVGTTRDRFTPALAATSGLTPGRDMFVAYSPERVSSGRVFADLAAYPKLVGGIDEESCRRAVEFYRHALDFDARPDLEQANGVWDLGPTEAAELAKLVETTFRDVNIALANEFARFATSRGLDVHKITSAANSQPYSHVHQPGVAVGGHCIPVYPRFYLAGDPEARLPAVAREVNDSMPAYAAEILDKAMGTVAGQRVVILGAAYRGGVKETAFSGVFPLAAALEAMGAHVTVSDPLYSPEEIAALGLSPHRPGDPCDAAVVQADHQEYQQLGPAALPGLRVLLDGRNCTRAARWPGVRHITLGGPD